VVDFVRADLVTGHLEGAFDGVGAVVHLAAATGGDEHDQFAATVIGTERLLAAMARSGCRRLILASSFAVYDWSRIDGTLDERSPLVPSHTLYARDGYCVAKSWQERVTRRLTATHGWDLVVLRPGFIWGKDRSELAACGQPLGPAQIVVGPLSRIPMTHVDNCADLFARVVDDPRASGETFNVVDGPGERIWRFLDQHFRGTGRRRVRVPIPYALTYFAVNAIFGRLAQKSPKLPGLLVPCRLEARMKPLTFTNRKAVRVLGWHPPLSYAECLTQSFDARG
jgi:UDP-glucose 4-epimerase